MPDATQAKRRRELGLCVTCGQHANAEGRSKCHGCLESARAIAAERRGKADRLGMCEACMKRARSPGRGNRCARCADKYAKSRRKNRRKVT